MLVGAPAGWRDGVGMGAAGHRHTYPAPPAVARRLAETAAQLREDDRDPVAVLIGVAATAVAEHQATTAA